MPNAKLSAKAVELLQKPFIAHIATVMRDGTPQVTPVWVDTDGEHVIINTVQGHLKTKNVKRNPWVAISIVDPQNPIRGFLTVRGQVVEQITDGADAHIDKLSMKYTGQTYNRRSAGEVRVIWKIKPERIRGGLAGE